MKYVALLAAGLLSAAAALLGSGFYLARPAPSEVGAPPAALGPVETLDIPSRSGSTLRGWYLAGEPDRGAVLLLHGVRANRRSLLGRMQLLNCAGYSVLAIDLQAHGESPGTRITFGALEGLDALSAAEYLRKRLPGRPIGAIGISLGGAATLLGPAPLPVDALVLESVFPDIDSAIADRIEIQIGDAGTSRLLASVYAAALSPFLGVEPEDLRPIDRIGAITTPVLIAAGTADRHTKIAETRALYAQAKAPKELWEVEGAGHVNLQRFAGSDYDRRILGFLGRHLGGIGEAAACSGQLRTAGRE